MSTSAFKRLARAKALQQTHARTRTALIHHIVHTASPRSVRIESGGKASHITIPPDDEPWEVRAAEIERRLQALGIPYSADPDPDGVVRRIMYLVGADAIGPDKRVERLLFAFGLDPITSLDES
jgi:hypothetical protein